MTSSTAAPGTNPSRVNAIASSVCPKKTNGALDVLDLSRELVLRSQAVIDGGNQVTSGYEFWYVQHPITRGFVASNPEATVDVNYG